MDCWKLLAYDGNQKFLLKFEPTEEASYELKISDLGCVWSEVLNDQQMRSRCKELNPRLEAPLKSIVEHIRSTIETQESDVFSVNSHSPDIIKITIKNSFEGGIPFLWDFVCKKSEEQCKDTFLSPIAKLVMSLKIANDRLTELVQRKDDEIRDYKEFSGVTVSRSYLETEEFNHEKFTDRLRRSIDYQNAIGKDIISILTLTSVNDKLLELKKDMLNPMPTLRDDFTKKGIAKIKGQTKRRRPKITRAPAKGVESGSESASDKEITKPKTASKKTSSTSVTQKAQKKKKVTDKRKKLF